MTNILKFQIETDAFYRSDEKEVLEEGFVAWIRGEDEEVIDGTENVSVTDKNVSNDADPVISDEVRAIVIKEFLEAAKLEIEIDARIRNGNGVYVASFPGAYRVISSFDPQV
jgi:hypothetical protein